MGFVLGGLTGEDYDRSYSDRELLGRIVGYFRPHVLKMLFVALLIAGNAAGLALLPVLTSRGIDRAISSGAQGLEVFTANLPLLALMLLAAGGFRDLTRVASGDPVMSRDMVAGNREAVRAALGAYRRQLERLESILDQPEELLGAGESARLTRDSIPIVRRSLLPARFEVVIAVPDRPGELARITRALGDAQVNVKDIEVLNVREAGGAIRLAFESLDEQERGTAALRAEGYEARSRTGNGNGRAD